MFRRERISTRASDAETVAGEGQAGRFLVLLVLPADPACKQRLLLSRLLYAATPEAKAPGTREQSPPTILRPLATRELTLTLLGYEARRGDGVDCRCDRTGVRSGAGAEATACGG